MAQGERSVDQLATLTGISVANTSQHLQRLWQAGLIAGRKEGQYVYYRLAGDEVTGLPCHDAPHNHRERRCTPCSKRHEADQCYREVGWPTHGARPHRIVKRGGE